MGKDKGKINPIVFIPPHFGEINAIEFTQPL